MCELRGRKARTLAVEEADAVEEGVAAMVRRNPHHMAEALPFDHGRPNAFASLQPASFAAVSTHTAAPSGYWRANLSSLASDSTVVPPRFH